MIASAVRSVSGSGVLVVGIEGATCVLRDGRIDGPVVGHWADLGRVVEQLRVRRVVVAVPLSRIQFDELVPMARKAKIVLGIITGDETAAPHADVFWASPPRDGVLPSSGRLFDVIVSAVLLVAAAPLWAVIALLIWLPSDGPVFFTQERVGRDGKRFRMRKFRTMRREAAQYARSPSEDNPQVTPIGRLLRATGFDELPQLWHVFLGEMRLVGPRPEMPYVVDRYVALERERLLATPGLTGLWQLYGDRSAPMHYELQLDLFYIACRSSGMDVRILMRTLAFPLISLARVLRGRSAATAANSAAPIAPQSSAREDA